MPSAKKTENRISVPLAKSADLSNLLELALDNLDYSSERRIHYVFLVEEALLRWKQLLPGDAQVEFRRKDTARDTRFVMEVPGEKADPFRLETDDEDEGTMVHMVDRLMSGVGTELKYKYRKGRAGAQGKNRLTLTLPKKNTESTLFRRTLLALMVPITIQTVVENLATSVDTLMMGFIDSDSLSAISLASQFNTIHMFIITSVVVAETILIAQFWGKREREKISSVLRLSVILSAVISLLFFAAAELFPRQIMAFYTDVPEIADAGVIYLRAIAFSYLVIPFYRTYYCFMRTTGAVKTVMRCAVLGCAVNAAMNAVLIYGLFGVPRMGVTGAGIATVTSSVVQLIAVILIRRKYSRKFLAVAAGQKMEETDQKGLLILFLTKAGPVVVQYLVYQVGQNFVASAFGHMGADVMAARALLSTLVTIFLSVKVGIGDAAAILIGAKMGKGNMDDAWKASKNSYIVTMQVGIIVIAFFVFTGFLLQFTPLALSAEAMRYFYILFIATSVNCFCGFLNAISCTGCLVAGGETMAVLIIDAVLAFCVFLPVSVAGTAGMIPAMFLMNFLLLDELLTAGFKYLAVRRRKWLRTIG